MKRALRTILFLFFAVLSYAGWGQYSGTGVFTQITSLSALTDGYYVVAYGTTQAMNNTLNAGNYFQNTAISPSGSVITNPATTIVWLIQTNGAGRTIYNEASGKYVSYSGSSNSAFTATAVTDNERWTFAYTASLFTLTNYAINTRLLQYNTGSPRFACYTGSQQNITLYKYVPNYYWNGNNASNLTVNNNWDNNSTKNWGATASTTWDNSTTFGSVWPASGSYNANFANTVSAAQIVNIPAAISVVPASTVIGVSGYSFVPSATQTFSSPVTLTSSLTVAPAASTTFTMSGVISGAGGFAQNGAGTTLLSGSNTYTGSTTISSGTLSAGNIVVSTGSSNLGNAATAVVLGGTSTAGTLSYTGAAATYTRGFTVNAGGGGIINATANLLTIGTGGITNGGSLTLSNSSSGGTTISSVISSTGSVTVNNSGAGVTTFSGANTYTGKTTVSAGTLSFATLGSVGAASSNLGAPSTVGNGTIDLGATGILKYTGSGNTSDRVINLTASGGTIDASGSTAAFTLSGGITGNTFNLNLTGTGTGASSATESGVIGTGAGSVTKSGAGTWILSGVNTYTGATTVSVGTLKLGTASERIADASALTVASGATFDLGGYSETVGSLAGAGSVTSTVTGNLAFTAGGDNTSTSFTGVISNGTATSVSVEKTGTGTLTLTGANTYTGTTKISAGELRLNPSANISLSGACDFNSGKLSTTGITATRTITFGSVILSDNSTLELETTNAHTITFTACSTLTANKILTINGWQGASYATGTTGGTVGKVFIGGTALSAAQLTQIRFYNSSTSTYYAATQLGTGEIVPTTVLVVTNPGNQNASSGFSVTVTAQDLGGNARNLTNATGIALSSATNTIGGTTSGTIAANGNAVTISGVTLTQGINATLTATRSSGDQPLPGTSGTFDVGTAVVPVSTLSVGTALTEVNLNGATFSISLTNTIFNTVGTLTAGNFTLNNAPTGVTISSVVSSSTTDATVTLAFNGTDFDANVTTLNLTILAAELSTGADLTSTNNLSITAYNETISVTGNPLTLTAFPNTTVNTQGSTERTYTISASQLQGNLVITAPTGFVVSKTTGSGFSGSISFTPDASGTVASSTVYVRFAPTAVGATGNQIITNVSTKATQVDVTVSGTGTSPANPASFSATTASSSQINLSATANGNSDNIVVVYNSTGIFTTPGDGTAPGIVGASLAGGTIWYKGTAASLAAHTSLTANTTYYYKAFSYDAFSFYSSGLTANATTAKIEPTNQVTNFATGTVTTSAIPLTWTAATGSQAPDGYLVKLNTGSVVAPTDATDPVDVLAVTGGAANKKVTPGSATGTTSFTSLTAGTMYNYANYSYTNTGTLIDFNLTSPATLNMATLPTAVTGVTFTDNGGFGAVINWTAGGYISATQTTLVFVKQSSTAITAGTATKAPSFYASNSNFSSGDPYELDAAAYCVYKGDGTNVTINGLSPSTTYQVLILTVVDASNYDSKNSNSAYATGSGNTSIAQYYAKTSAGNLDLTTSWTSDAAGGTGVAPANFTANNQIFNIRNNATVTIGANWTVSGIGSKIVLGDGTNACNFTIPSAYSVTAPALGISVNANATLTLQNTTIPAFGTLAAGSTVVYDGSSAQTVSSGTYGNLTIQNSGAAKTAAGNITINAGNALAVTANTVLDMVGYQVSATGATATVTINGILKTANTAGFSGTASTTVHSSNTSITLGTASTIVYNSGSAQAVTGGPYANLQISNSSAVKTAGGNITLGNSNTFTLDATVIYNAGTTTITFGTSGTALINGTFKTANTTAGGFSGASNSSIVSINAPTVTLGSGSTVEYTSTSAQTISTANSSGTNGTLTYYNLLISGITGTKTFNTLPALAAGGTFTVNASCVADLVQTQMSFGGTGCTVTINGTVKTQKAAGGISGSASSVFISTNNPTITFASGSTVEYNRNGNQDVSGSTYGNLLCSTGGIKLLTGNVLIQGGNSLTLNATVTLDAAAYLISQTGSGTATVSILGTLKTSNSNGLSGSASTTVTNSNTTLALDYNSTVDYYSSGAQIITGASYGYITNSVSGPRTLHSTDTILVAWSITPGSGPYTIGTSTVVFNGASGQNIPVLPVSSGSNYYNLIYRGGSTGTLLGNITVANVVDVARNTLYITNSTAKTLTVNGTLKLSGGNLDFGASGSTAAGNVVLLGNFIQTTGNTNTAATVLNGLLSFAGSGTVIAPQTISLTSSTTFPFTNITINTGTVVQVNNSFVLTGSSTANYKGTLTVNGTLNMLGNTVTASGANSIFTINSGGTLMTSNSGGINTTIAQTNITRTFTAGANYVFNGATATAFPTTAQQTTFGDPANVTVNAAITTNRALGISGTLALNNSIVTTGPNILSLTVAGTSNITGPSSTAYVNGKLQMPFASSTTLTQFFPIGDAAKYAPVTLIFASISVNGGIVASTANSPQANFNTSDFDPNKYVNRTWTLANASTTFTTYSVQFDYTNIGSDILNSADPNIFIGGLYTSSWSYPTVAALTATSTKLSGISTFGDFMTGEPAVYPIVTTNATFGPICNDVDNTISVAYTNPNPPGTTFTGTFYVQLSGSTGVFPTNTTSNIIGTGTGSSPIDATIPAGQAFGSGYRVRVINTAPVTYGTNNGNNINVIASATSVSPSTAQSITQTLDGSTLTVSEGATVTSRRWRWSDNGGTLYYDFSPAQTGTTYTPNFATAGNYLIICESTYPTCGAIQSNAVSITVIAPGPPTITHTPLGNTTSTANQTVVATVTSTTAYTCNYIKYRINGGTWVQVNGTNTSGNTWNYTIPGQVAGTLIEYYIAACNVSGTTTSPANVTTSSPYGSFYEYTINCTPASSGTKTIAFQGFEFVGSSGYTFSVDNTNTAPAGAQNYPAHANAVEWRYYNQGANGTLNAVNRNSCGCMYETYSGLPSCPDVTNPIFTAGGSTGTCRTYSSNSRGVYTNNSNGVTENPSNARSRNGSYSYIHQSRNDGGDGARSYIYFDDVAIPDAANASNIKVIAYVTSISSSTLSNGAESTDKVTLSAMYNSNNTPNAMVSDITCGADWFLYSSNQSSSVAGTTNQRWDYAGNLWNTTPAISGTTTKNKITLTNIPAGTTNIRAMLTLLNDDASNYEQWAVDDIQIIADYPAVTPTVGTYYRSKQNGKWESISTWEVSTNVVNGYTQACQVPNYSNSDSIIIRSGHTVVITADENVNQVRVLPGGILKLNNGCNLVIKDTLSYPDLVVEGTFEDAASSYYNVVFDPGAKWKLGTNGTFIKSYNSSAAVYRDNYETGMSNIPPTANWYIKSDGTKHASFTSTNGTYYPNLYFICTTPGVTWDPGSLNVSSSIFSGSADYTRVLGNLTIGGGVGNGNVVVLNENTNSQPMRVDGNMYIDSGSTFTNSGLTGTVGTGIELKGNLTVNSVNGVNGVLDLNTSCACNTNGILRFSGTGTQTISGAGTLDLNVVEMKKTAQSILSLNRDVTVNDSLQFTTGIINTNANKITVAGSDRTGAITGYEAPYSSTTGTPAYTNDKYIIGKLERNIIATGLYSFPVGDVVPVSGVGEGYNPVELDIRAGSPTPTGYATAKFTAGDPGTFSPAYSGTITCGVGGGGVDYTDMTGEGWWNFTSATPNFNYDIHLHPNQVNLNTYPNGSLTLGSTVYTNNYRALKTTSGNAASNFAWNASAIAGDPCVVSGYYDIIGFNYTGFSDFAPGGGMGSGALPVELIYLTATPVDDSYIRIDWATAVEINNLGFEVQRSTDGLNFAPIGWVDGHNNSTIQQYYNLDDLNVVPDLLYYYRLKQFDYDGAYEYSDIVSARINGDKNSVTVSEFMPNPTTGNSLLFIYAPKEDKVNIRLYNLLGQVVKEINQDISKGNNMVQLNFSDVASATYSARIQLSDYSTSKKVLVAK